MTLSDLVKYLKEQYPQTSLETEIFDFEKIMEVKSKEPKYFFRGENKLYDKTTTTLSRILEKSIFNQFELFEFYSLHSHLYLFLREAIWNISVVERKEHGNPFIELAIIGLLQHYGFDTSFLDVTSNIDIAANFASMNNSEEKGRLLVIESNGLNKEKVNYYFDLAKCPGKRPKSQNSYVIWDQFGNLNLKDETFLSKHNGKWFKFRLDEKDKSNFYDQTILSTKNDKIVCQINEWWKYSDIKKKVRSLKVIDFVNTKIIKLNNNSI